MILIVDDDVSMQRALVRLLKALGHESVTVKDGADAEAIEADRGYS